MREQRLRQIMAFLLVAAGLLGLHSCTSQTTPADLVLQGGRIITIDPTQPEVEAVAVTGDRLVARGSSKEIAPLIGPDTQVVDLDGAIAIPGFIESHAHFMSLGRAKMQLDLTRAQTWDEIVAMVATAVEEAEPGEWIFGRGWHQEKWDRVPEPSVDGLPIHHSLSEVSPDNPVQLTHASGHATIVNAKAMELAGISAATPDPEGGEIVRDNNGQPIGTLRENAENLVGRVQEQTPNEATRRRMVELAGEECLSKGITSFFDAGVSYHAIDLFKQMAAEGELPVRLWVAVSEPNDQLEARLGEYTGIDEPFLTVGGIKRLIDGALGAHGGWLLEPYSDLPESTGLNTYPVDDLAETARLAVNHRLQLCVHAIGDRANRETLDVYEQAFLQNPERSDFRWRIEHAQHLHPDDIPRFAELGVIASMQPTHCTSDGPWVPRRLGEERARAGAYMWRRLLDSGAVICTGTDAPVEDVDPIATFHAAVTRQMGNGERFYPEQAMKRQEALRTATLDGAYAIFQESRKGSLEVGKLADITILSKDILSVPEDEIRDTEVLYTIVGGKVQYRTEDLP
jgi:predicted amidohydrolase YtcJ